MGLDVEAKSKTLEHCSMLCILETASIQLIIKTVRFGGALLLLLLGLTSLCDIAVAYFVYTCLTLIDLNLSQ